MLSCNANIYIYVYVDRDSNAKQISQENLFSVNNYVKSMLVTLLQNEGCIVSDSLEG